jgi:GAF domain-containing protein
VTQYREPVYYDVDLFIDEERADEYEAWLIGHRDDMLQIDGFEAATILRSEALDEDLENGQRHIAVRYELRDRAALEAYQANGAATMRQEAVTRFGSAFSARRSILTCAGNRYDKTQAYADLAARAEALFSDERDWLANFSNLSALLFEDLPRLNWAGFYILKGDELVLGPFQGKTACVRIANGRGVCGAAIQRGESMVVADVHEFAGHIACDAASRAELVVPIIVGGEAVAVLDLDSPALARFDEDDRAGIERVVEILIAATDLSPLR